MASYEDLYQHGDLFVAGRAELENVGRSVGIGAVMVGDEFQRVQRYIHRAEMDIVDRFLEDVQRFCVDNQKRFVRETYEAFARAYVRANYLNPVACVVAMTRVLDSNMRVQRGVLATQALRDECAEYDITVLDVFRYAELIARLA